MSNTVRCEAERLKNVKFSPVRKVLGLANEMQMSGREVVHFEIGEPDFETPDIVVQNTIKALVEEKKTHYASNLGDLSLRKQIAEKLWMKSNIKADPATEILVTIGAAEAIFASIMATVNEGDEVIVLTPAFMFYENTINMAGAKMVEVMLKAENRFEIDPEEVKAKITERTKMIVLTNPHNPTGVVFSKESLIALGKLAVEHDLLLLSDEIYDEIVYDGKACFSLASVEEFKKNVITINGFSKAYAMTGWRLGYVVAPAEIRSAMLKVHQYTTTCAPTFIQIGAARSMLEPECLAAVEKMRNTFEKRRDLVLEMLGRIKGIRFVPTGGAFYILVDISAFGMSDEEFAEKLLNEQGVAVVPASGFSANFQGHIRISYAASEENIRKGLEKLKTFCDEQGVKA